MPQNSLVVPGMLDIYFVVLLLESLLFSWCEKQYRGPRKASVPSVLWSDNHKHPKILQHFSLTHAHTAEIFPPQTIAIQMGGGQAES